jgi:hypothetical protein
MWIAFVAVGVGLLAVGTSVLWPTLVASKRGKKTAGKRSVPVWRSGGFAAAILVIGVMFIGAGLLARPLEDSEAPSERVRVEEPAASSVVPAAPETDGATPLEPDSQTGSDPAAGPRGLSDADRYRLAVIEVNNRVTGQLDNLTNQLVASRYEDPTWVADTTSVLSAMVAVAAKARSIVPTTGYEDAHAAWMEGIASYDWAARNMTVAIQGPDYDLMNECTTRLGSASASFRRATELMQKVGTP